MAQIDYTWLESRSAGSLIDSILWTGLAGATSDTGTPFATAGLSDKSVQLFGTLGTFVLEGTNDPAKSQWATLTNEAHTPITDAGGARIEVVLQNTLFIRPRVSGAAAGVSVMLCGRRPRADGGTG